MKKNVLGLTILSALILPLASNAAPPAQVTNGSDAGPGSLRAALASGATQIVINPQVSTVVLTESLEYTGTAPLSIIGANQVIDGTSFDDDILRLTQGADLDVRNLAFQGAGDYDIEHQGVGKGIFVDVPIDREGVVSVKLTNVTVSDTANHGVHVSDCTTGDDCGAGQGGDGDGSPASISLVLKNVVIDGAGFGKQDADGVRVDDRGAGDILLVSTHSLFQYVGGDGVELDEGDEGDVLIDLHNNVFDNNGAYCFDVDDDGPFDPIEIDPACDDDGDPDVDDAFDIDEAGPGAIAGIISNAIVTNNYDEGLDFDAEGGGNEAGLSVDLDLINIFTLGNTDDGIKISEEDEDSVVVNMRDIEADGNVVVEEEGDGDITVSLKGSIQTNGEVEIDESDDGILTMTVNGSDIDVLDLDEDNAGSGSTVKVRGSTIGTLNLDDVEEI